MMIGEMELKAFIFDLDGVIVFTDRYHYQAWKTLADDLRIPFDEIINDRLRGVGRMESLDIILEKADKTYSREEKTAFAEKKNNIYRDLLRQMQPSDVSDEVRKTLEKLRQRGHRLAIGSSSKNTKFILKQVGIEEYFDAISDGTNITKSKPNPEVFVKAAEFLREEAANCIVVEDAKAGIDAAKAADMMAVGIGDAAGYEKTDIVIKSFSQLLDI